MHATSPTPFSIFCKDDYRFRGLHRKCDTIFKDLLASGIGASVRDHEPFCASEEDSFWAKGVFGFHSPESLLNAVFYYTGLPTWWGRAETAQEISICSNREQIQVC